ncbi:hypothetical protein [Roseovarius sp. Pro17]|uniref:hypothetical protein n=1 Tax=Roseovarius sp. Pro17 TaxID=3108175 RepID=UPI002D7A0E1D|nr:hypothetical protein [Roseovarius sp. Pro17]
MSLETAGVDKSLGGWTKDHGDHANNLNYDMRFTIYLSPQIAKGQEVPVILLAVRADLHR